jgi:hypothetical protein
VQLEHFERPLNDDPIRHVHVTHGFLSEKQAFESDRFYRQPYPAGPSKLP